MAKKLSKTISKFLMSMKFIVFMSFFITSFIMYRLGRKEIAIVLIATGLFFLLFNKIESIDRRLTELEGGK